MVIFFDPYIVDVDHIKYVGFVVMVLWILHTGKSVISEVFVKMVLTVQKIRKYAQIHAKCVRPISVPSFVYCHIVVTGMWI